MVVYSDTLCQRVQFDGSSNHLSSEPRRVRTGYGSLSLRDTVRFGLHAKVLMETQWAKAESSLNLKQFKMILVHVLCERECRKFGPITVQI